MIDLVLLTETRQLYDLQLQAARQCQWGVTRQLNFLCMAILDEIVPDALDSLYGPFVPESCPPPLEESLVAVPCE